MLEWGSEQGLWLTEWRLGPLSWAAVVVWGKGYSDIQWAAAMDSDLDILGAAFWLAP